MQQLQPGTTLQGGKYKIERVLGQGGFGITYLAEQTMLGRKVAIKEFFLKEYCDRAESTSAVTFGSTGGRELTNRMRDKFVKEARNLAKLKHPNIVKVIDIFEENNTAYYIMEYCEGGSLADKVKREGYLSEPVATRYICQMASALAYLHERQMNHLDVKPANIMLNEGDEAVLIDFGLSKQYDDAGNQTSTTPVGISEGYAPMEQYKQGGVQEFSPETDIYALGATFFKLLTGITPPSASDVNEDGLPVDLLKAKAVSEEAIAVICRAMESRKKDRTKDVRVFIDDLNRQNVAPTLPIKEEAADDEATVFIPTTQHAEEKREVRQETEVTHKSNVKKGISRKILIFGVLGMLVGVAVFFILSGGRSSAPEETSNLQEIETESDVEPNVANNVTNKFEDPHDVFTDEDAKAYDGITDGAKWIDLGLPSGNKWATCNVGASSATEAGDYYAWGETKTRKSYSEKNTWYYSEKGLDKAHDVAYNRMGRNWRVPSSKDFEELRSNCRIANDDNGIFYIGPNGHKLYFPQCGYMYENKLYTDEGKYWTSTPVIDDDPIFHNLIAETFNVGPDATDLNQIACYHGLNVRGVTNQRSN